MKNKTFSFAAASSLILCAAMVRAQTWVSMEPFQAAVARARVRPQDVLYAEGPGAPLLAPGEKESVVLAVKTYHCPPVGDETGCGLTGLDEVAAVYERGGGLKLNFWFHGLEVDRKGGVVRSRFSSDSSKTGTIVADIVDGRVVLRRGYAFHFESRVDDGNEPEFHCANSAGDEEPPVWIDCDGKPGIRGAYFNSYLTGPDLLASAG